MKPFPLKTNNETTDALRNMYPHNPTNFRNSQTLPRFFANKQKNYAI